MSKDAELLSASPAETITVVKAVDDALNVVEQVPKNEVLLSFPTSTAEIITVL